jgi:hypothetical protein
VVAVNTTIDQNRAVLPSIASECSSLPTRIILALVGMTLACPSLEVRAQEISLFAGGAHAKYADSLSGTAGTGSVRIRSYRPLTAFDFQGSLSQFTTGEWAAQVGGNATHFWRLSGTVSGGVAASGSYADFERGAWSGFGTAGPMLAVSGRSFLVTAGASAGATRTIDEAAFATLAGAVRGRIVPVEGLSFDLGWFGTLARETVVFADVTSGITWTAGPLLLAASGAVRVGDLNDDPWGQLRVQVTPRPAFRIEAAAGRYPRDLTGFTDGLFVQAGVRLVFGSASPRQPVLPTTGIVVERTADDAVRLIVRFAGTPSDLAIAGDFSQWDPIPLQRDRDGVWSVILAIPPGVHTYAIIADGTWTLPDDVAGIDDEFGGKVGVLVVREP